MFTEKEVAYMKSQHLARIGTVSTSSQPDVSPVGFRFDGKYFHISGMKNKATRKYKNVANGNTLVALAIDDLESVDPWVPRGIKVFGTAEIAGDESLRIKPTISWSWNVEGPAMVDGRFIPHKTIHK
jgi:pyridoxamine 5'-phosphate oxidase family protein